MPAAAAAIVAATIGSFLNLVLPKLYDAVHQDLREDVVSIMSDIQLIHASFEDFFKSPVPTTKSQEVWLKQVILLVYEIEDTTGCFLCNFLPRDQQIADAGFLSRASSFAVKKLTPLSIQMARKIRQLKEKSKNLKDRYEFCKGAVTPPTAPAEKEDGGANAHVTGKEKEEELLQLVLPTSSESQKKLKVISVAGYSALCNTRLVDRVLNNKQVQNQFPRRRSTIINAKDMEVGLVINEIASQLSLNQNGGSTFSNASTKDERYLIVIDNVDMDSLMAIIAECRDKNYSMVIVATTDFTEEINCKCRSSPALDKGADGKYLKIQLLTEKAEQEEMTRNKEEMLDELVRNYKEILSSFNLINCLLYFCMFPRYHLVRWNHLIMRYGAEGIDIHELEKQRDGKSRNPLDCLKIFINNQAVQVKKNGQVKACQLPVMMLDQISGVSKTEKFLTLFCRSTPTAIKHEYPSKYSPVRRLSLHPIRAGDDRLSLPNAKSLSQLRTLAVFHTGNMDQIDELSKYELLRVLDLKACTVLTNAHLKKICNLLLLKYLSLGDSINEVPRKIAKLQWLETLSMTKTQEVRVPMEVIELPRIKHLLGKFKLYGNDITPNKMKQLFSKPSQLERLSGFVIVDGKEFLDLMSIMVNLEKVKIWCAATKWTEHVTTAIRKFIGNDPSKNLNLSIECKNYPQEIIKCLQHHGTLTSLKLHGDLNLITHREPEVQRTIIDVLNLKGIQVMCLSDTNLSGDEIVCILKLFKDLKYLKLVRHKHGHLDIPAGCLHKLEQLCLVGLDTLHNIKIQAGSLLLLASLHMLFKEIELEGGLRKPNILGINIKNFPRLAEIALYSNVTQDIKEKWQGQASDHTNDHNKNPKVLFIQRPTKVMDIKLQHGCRHPVQSVAII